MAAVPYEEMTVAELSDEYTHLRLEKARLELEGGSVVETDRLLGIVTRLLRNKSRL